MLREQMTEPRRRDRLQRSLTRPQEGRPDTAASANVSSPVFVRSATSDDRETIVTLTRDLALETVGKVLPLATIRAGVQRVFDCPERGRYFLACIDDQVVGQLAVLYVELNAWRDGLIYWIDDVYVRPAHRGQGVYRSLFSHVQQLACQTPGVIGIRLHCAEENEAAQAVYGRLGMRRGGVTMEWFCPADSGGFAAGGERATSALPAESE
jgi:GNAT superfamily N-acetyltransferase